MTTKADRTPADPLIVFVHNMKTGGMTLRQIIRCQYPPHAVLEVPENHFDLSQVPHLTSTEAARLQVVQGHFPVGLHERIDRPCRYVTLLREPIDRAVSMYFYWLQKRSADPPRQGLMDAIQRFLEDHVVGGEVLDNDRMKEMDNAQVRRLSGMDPDLGACTPEMLKVAKANLRKYFEIVGITDRFDETLVLLARRFGWRYIHYVKANVTEERVGNEEISDGVRAAIHAYNELDEKLYKTAGRVLASSLERAGDEFADEVIAFQRANHSFRKRLRAQNGRTGTRPARKPRVHDVILDANVQLLFRDRELQQVSRRMAKQERVQQRLTERLEGQDRERPAPKSTARLARRVKDLERRLAAIDQHLGIDRPAAKTGASGKKGGTKKKRSQPAATRTRRGPAKR